MGSIAAGWDGMMNSPGDTGETESYEVPREIYQLQSDIRIGKTILLPSATLQ